MFDLTPPPSDPLLDRASAIAAFEILDHTCGGLEPLLRREQPSRPTLAPARYYLAGVNSGQRRVYDGHCSERYAERSPFHYTSREEVAARAVLAGDIWAGRAVYEVSDAFVAFDGLVLQDSESPARLFAFERMPGFNGLGRLLLALERLQLLRLAPGQRQASLRPADLTLGRFAARHREQVEELPEERGIENVHAFTYARTFAAAGGAGGEEASAQCRASEPVLAAGAVRRSRCLLVIEQFWTANYWHWLTDALPKALLFATMREAGLFDPECKVLAYDLGWNRQFLALAGYDDSQVLAYDATRLDHACRVLLPTVRRDNASDPGPAEQRGICHSHTLRPRAEAALGARRHFDDAAAQPARGPPPGRRRRRRRRRRQQRGRRRRRRGRGARRRACADPRCYGRQRARRGAHADKPRRADGGIEGGLSTRRRC